MQIDLSWDDRQLIIASLEGQIDWITEECGAEIPANAAEIQHAEELIDMMEGED